MKKFTYLILTLLLINILTSCQFSGTPELLSIGFTDDKTLEYKFAIMLGDNGGGFSVHSCKLTPDNGYKIRYQSHDNIKGNVYFDRPIPDGTTLELVFHYSSSDEYALTHTFVKGE